MPAKSSISWNDLFIVTAFKVTCSSVGIERYRSGNTFVGRVEPVGPAAGKLAVIDGSSTLGWVFRQLVVKVSVWSPSGPTKVNAVIRPVALFFKAFESLVPARHELLMSSCNELELTMGN